MPLSSLAPKTAYKTTEQRGEKHRQKERGIVCVEEEEEEEEGGGRRRRREKKIK